MMAIVASSITAIVCVICLIIYTTVYSALNTATLSAGALNMVNLIPTILAAGIIISLIATVLMIFRGK